jgi:hypothetical protein
VSWFTRPNTSTAAHDSSTGATPDVTYGCFVRGVFVMIATAAAVALLAAAPATADSNDNQYLEQLNANGLGCGQGAFPCSIGDSDMIRMGHEICRQVRGGNSKLSVEQAILQAKPGLQPAQAVKLVSAAVTAYCP